MNIVKFSEQTVLRLCSYAETTTFKVNQVSVIDRITEVNYQINSISHHITKVEEIVRFK